MKWFDKIPTIKFSDFYILTGLHNGEVADWEYVDSVGKLEDDHSYHVIKYVPTGKLYKTCWGVKAPNGKNQPSGIYNPNTDYLVLCEVEAKQITVYKVVK